MVIQLENAGAKIRTHICLIQVSFTFSYHLQTPLKQTLLISIAAFWGRIK